MLSTISHSKSLKYYYNSNKLPQAIMGTTHRLRILFWKNYTLKKRHYISAICEILLPTIFAIGVAISRGLINRNELLNGIRVNTTYHEELSQLQLMNNFSLKFLSINSSYYPLVLYTPKTHATEAIIRHVNETYQHLFETMEWTSYTNCSEPQTNCTLGVWRQTETEEEMEQFAAEYFNARISNRGKYPKGVLLAGIVFTSDLERKTSGGKISYKIRGTELFDTDELFSTYGIDSVPPEYEQYFIGLQILLDRAIIQYHTKQTPRVDISIQGFPYPPHHGRIVGDIHFLYNFTLAQAIILGFLFTILTTVRILVNEKGSGVQELLTLMGLPKWMHWVGHFSNSLTVLSINATVLVAVFYIPFFGSEVGPLFLYTDPTVLWIFLLLYAAATTSFSFFISTLFGSSVLAIPGSIAIHAITHYPIILPLLEGDTEPFLKLNFWLKILICLIPNNAIYYGTLIFADLEIKKFGMDWSKLDHGIGQTDNFILLHVMLLLTIEACAYMVFSIYFEKILPSNYGIRKAWYYILLPSEWGIGHQPKFDPETWISSFAYRKDPEAFENEPKNAKVGIEIRNLRKEFNGTVAVVGMDLKMYEGQITALLGQNGAGKSTAISMLVGMKTPTSGTAFVNNYNIRTEMEKIRTNLSLCPQHNMLFNSLSVKENFKFFAMLNGIDNKDALQKVDELLVKLRLDNKENCLVGTLSGGEKRKVSVGCALINGSKIVILDEPTAGLDVDNRRIIWDVLLKFRIGRTIVLTTHFMEEADNLGDRIAIMDQGELICVGTPNFLKNYYGAGYVLKLNLESNQKRNNILEIVQQVNPEATVLKRHTGYLRELLISIPCTTTSNFPELFLNLERKKAEFGIQNFALGQTSMDDVFARVGDIYADDSLPDDADTSEDNKNINTSPGGFTKKASGTQLRNQRFRILMKKKVIYVLRRKYILLAQILIPIACMIFAILITNHLFRKPEPTQPPLTMSLLSYINPITAFTSTSEDLANNYEAFVGSSSERVIRNDLESYYLNVGIHEIATFRNRHIVGAEINDTHIKAMHSTVAKHGISLSVNIAMSTVLRNSTGLPLTIEVTNQAFHDDAYEIRNMGHPSGSGTFLFMILVPIGISILVSPIVILPIEERLTSVKHLQRMTGIDPLMYWISFYVIDFLFLAIVAAIMVTCFPIFEKYETFTSQGGVGVAYLILIAFAFQAIPFIYIISLSAKSVAGGLTILSIICCVTSLTVSYCAGLAQIQWQDSLTWFTWLPSLVPGYGVSKAFETFSFIAITNSHCKIFTEEQKKHFCFPKDLGTSFRISDDIRGCCDQCGETGFPACFKGAKYFEWTTTASYFTDYVTLPGLKQHLFGMFLTGVYYFVLLIIMEKGIIQQFKKYLRYWFSNQPEFYFQKNTEDSDVIMESERVDCLISNNLPNNDDTLVVNNCCKHFEAIPAVSNVSFGVKRGECFGLLGVNGAGKTTMFRMLAGEMDPSLGNAFMPGCNLEDDKAIFLQNLGYCPQFDGTIDFLTGNEMLEVFGKLRGISRSAIRQQVSQWMQRMGLTKSGKIQCRNYSAGMKRRLAIAIAMIGEPKIVLLDEPTAGVDPIARRKFRKTITSLVTSGQSIVLISHSIEECEQLCDRLAIMVNGELQCLGDVEYLKEKFAKGFILTIKLKLMMQDKSKIKLNKFKQKILTTFTPCTLNLLYENVLEFHLPNKNIGFSFLFAWMESLLYDYRDILEGYEIKETTLHDVFFSFARQQIPERKAKQSLMKRLKSRL